MKMAKRIVNTQAISHDEWLAIRQKGIGSSDAPGILGVSTWASPLSVYADKLGLADPQKDNDRLEWGRIMEGPIAERYAAKTGRPQTEEPYILQHPELPWMLCNLDRIIQDPEKGTGVLEIKSYDPFDQEGEARIDVQVQLQHQLAVTGVSWGSICGLAYGRTLIWQDYERNDIFIEALVKSELAFWDCVLKKNPPDPDSHKATKEAITKLFPKDTGKTINLPPEAMKWALFLEVAQEEKKDAEGAITLMQNKIALAMGDATIGRLPDNSGFSHKTQKRKAYQVPESEFRVLRRLKTIKEEG